MTIRDPVKFCAGLWDWHILQGCFGDTLIMPTDVDGFVERNGRFLWLETKAPGVPIPEGQLLTFKALIKTGIFSVLIIWGNANDPQEIQVMTRYGIQERIKCDVERLRKIVSRWFEYADGF